MNVKYVPIVDVAHVGFKNYFALFTFIGTVHEWGQFYQLFKTENYLKILKHFKTENHFKTAFWNSNLPH